MLACCCADASGGAPVEALPDKAAAPVQPPNSQPNDMLDKMKDEFEVNVSKSAEHRIGLDISAVRGQVLKVWKVKQGLIEDWNNTQPEEMWVKTGDAVVEVNGIRGSSDNLLTEISQKSTLKMIFARGAFNSA
mmetsp:Transcript_9667/g.17385  ORF Transcript_9667/g.17385 Transcript_9667/m.17385 type:complete len:133 (+) Transcript_9667:49-447(+)|eukprot:CAMPEP_0197662556 /NCGR_PEP_ID=MMETSP1338-20131121/53913_1 /TAXON_ID=43686 ORGANISM="Pelagodinium beii, Strain RCC1491" /NCGR_SAMPLE_ID=MMETSP1338 /ASSEMBLY_ACC=CAM_ASM_000754 /LENGTH=132 /DNA_ID=CAMNT_0043240457 /DNA_START=49 /DNA_END=447 /DNA_ORIENTATION=-